MVAYTLFGHNGNTNVNSLLEEPLSKLCLLISALSFLELRPINSICNPTY